MVLRHSVIDAYRGGKKAKEAGTAGWCPDEMLAKACPHHTNSTVTQPHPDDDLPKATARYFRARCLQSGRAVAVKKVPLTGRETTQHANPVRERVRTEVSVLREVRSPHVVELLDCARPRHSKRRNCAPSPLEPYAFRGLFLLHSAVAACCDRLLPLSRSLCFVLACEQTSRRASARAAS